MSHDPNEPPNEPVHSLGGRALEASGRFASFFKRGREQTAFTEVEDTTCDQV